MKEYLIKYIFVSILTISFCFSADDTIIVGDEATPISLFKLESNKYFRSKEVLGEKHTGYVKGDENKLKKHLKTL